jgi:hypothetical protein
MRAGAAAGAGDGAGPSTAGGAGGDASASAAGKLANCDVQGGDNVRGHPHKTLTCAHNHTHAQMCVHTCTHAPNMH